MRILGYASRCLDSTDISPLPMWIVSMIELEVGSQDIVSQIVRQYLNSQDS